jgi:predicted nuclease with TOPRIM domain
MKKIVFYFVVGLSFINCQDKPQTSVSQETTTTDNSSFKMYEMSEMAALMEQMYVDNQRLKEKIENNDNDLGQMPEHYNSIHSATLTEPSDLDDFFKSEARKFIVAQSLVYTETENKKENFNNMVTACIECHYKKCTGPIERIKKLYIK